MTPTASSPGRSKFGSAPVSRESASGAPVSEPTVIVIEPGHADAFVFRYLSDLASVGLFAPQRDPLELGAAIIVRVGPMTLSGIVTWRNPAGSETPGVGVRLSDLEDDTVDDLLVHIRAMAYLPDNPEA